MWFTSWISFPFFSLSLALLLFSSAGSWGCLRHCNHTKFVIPNDTEEIVLPGCEHCTHCEDQEIVQAWWYYYDHNGTLVPDQNGVATGASNYSINVRNFKNAYTCTVLSYCLWHTFLMFMAHFHIVDGYLSALFLLVFRASIIPWVVKHALDLHALCNSGFLCRTPSLTSHTLNSQREEGSGHAATISSCCHDRNLMWPIRSTLFVDCIHCHGVQLRHNMFSGCQHLIT